MRVPLANTNNIISRNVVKQMASDGFLPVIALEACVELGRTYQAYKRGGYDEARERITEEFSGAVFWLGGVTGLNWIFEKIGQKMLHLPNKTVSTASDDVRKPLENFLHFERNTKNGGEILLDTMAKFKFAKVIASVILANAFIGFALPKINQSITKARHKKQNLQETQNQQNTNKDNFIKAPSLDNFKNGKDVPFTGFDFLSLANKFENNRNYKLLSVDAGTASGRAISARNNDERIEILFRDLSSVFFYMFSMPLLNKLFNYIEHGRTTRLDPVSAEFATLYMNEYMNDAKAESVSADKFKRDFFGTEKELPQDLKAKFTGKNTKIINLDTFIADLKTRYTGEELARLTQTAEKMSELQPKVKGIAILTEGQVKAVLTGGHINNPEFLLEYFKNRFGNDVTKSYKFIAQNELDDAKAELEHYVKSVIEKANKTSAKEITTKMIRKASNHNLRLNALNWGIGFITSAAFLSTFIPKLQYKITKWRTGSDDFPGTAQYRDEEKNKTKQAA